MSNSHIYLAMGLLLAVAATHSTAEEIEVPASKTESDGHGGFYVTFEKGQTNISSKVGVVLNERLLRKASSSPSNHVFDWPTPTPTAAVVKGIEVVVHASTKKVTLHLDEPLGREHLTWRVWVAESQGITAINNKIYAAEPKE